MRNSFGSIGAMLAIMAAAKHRAANPRPLTKEQIEAADKRTEIQRWNDAVEQRKADKKGGE